MPKTYKIGEHEIPLVSEREAKRLIAEGAHVIADEADGTCELCGKVDEVRPYGPKGEWVCFDCGMKDEAAVERGLRKRMAASAAKAGKA